MTDDQIALVLTLAKDELIFEEAARRRSRPTRDTDAWRSASRKFIASIAAIWFGAIALVPIAGMLQLATALFSGTLGLLPLPTMLIGAIGWLGFAS